MRNINLLIKPASSHCNLNCRYCFYHDVSLNREVNPTGIMNERTMRHLIDKAIGTDPKARITFAFQGGEPTLAGLDYFKAFCAYVNETKTSTQTIFYTIQTNGTLLTEAWFQFLKENRFLVGISLDGDQTLHDMNRVTLQDQPTHALVMKSIEGLRRHQIDFNILTVLTSSVAQKPKELYRFYKDHDFRYLQLIPCLPKLKGESDPFALTPSGFASFYKTFYDLWLEDVKNNDIISVDLFENVIPMFKGIKPMQCGMLGSCSPQFVIEADGSVYPCDFYALDEYVCGNINSDSLEQILHHPNMIAFLNEKKRMSQLCASCRYKPICNGNCKRLNITYFDENTCGYQEFLDHAYPTMIKLAQRLP